jgi:hypothetical protein
VSVRPAWLPCTKVEDPASKVGVSYFDRLAVVDASGANVNRCGGEATHIGEQVVFGVMCEVASGTAAVQARKNCFHRSQGADLGGGSIAPSSVQRAQEPGEAG